MENMETNRRRSSATLAEILLKESSQFQFHAAVKLLESMKPDHVPLGQGSNINQEALEIKTHTTLEMSPKDIQHISFENPQNQPKMLINFFGLSTLQGPLPESYRNLLLHRIQEGDMAMRDFLDIFNHRFASLLHRIRKKYWIGIAIDKPQNTLIGKTIASFGGVNSTAFENRLKIPDQSLLYYAGLLWHRPRSAMGLRNIIRGFFKTPAQIHQFQGKWTLIDIDQTTLIGNRGRFNILGQEAILGKHLWEQQSTFIVQLGPMSLKKFATFLKPGVNYKAIRDLIHLYAGSHQDFILNLVLDKNQVPPLNLGKGAALGWTAWLKSRPFLKDDAQAVLNSNPRFYPKFSVR